MIKQIIITIATIIGVPLILHAFKWDDWKTSIFSGILLALIEQVIYLIKQNHDMKLQLIKYIQISQNSNTIDKILLLISNNIMKLSIDGKKENNIFVNFYIDKLQSMAYKIDKSYHSGKFEMDYNIDKEDYIQLSKSIFKVFDKRDDDYFYTISRSDKSSIEWFFDINKMSNTYLKMAYSCLKDGKIKNVKRLFIFEKLDDLNFILLNLLLRLHQNSDFEIKLISIDTFMAHFKKEHLSDDFGIYGRHFVFENNLNSFNGEELFCGFNVNLNRINEYTECFNLVWEIAYGVQFDNNIEHIERSDDTIKFPVKKFELQLHNMNFDDIDKIQSVVYDEYKINSI